MISYSGGQLDGPVAFLAACPYIILYSSVILSINIFGKCLLIACDIADTFAAEMAILISNTFSTTCYSQCSSFSRFN